MWQWFEREFKLIDRDDVRNRAHSVVASTALLAGEGAFARLRAVFDAAQPPRSRTATVRAILREARRNRWAPNQVLELLRTVDPSFFLVQEPDVTCSLRCPTVNQATCALIQVAGGPVRGSARALKKALNENPRRRDEDGNDLRKRLEILAKAQCATANIWVTANVTTEVSQASLYRAALVAGAVVTAALLDGDELVHVFEETMTWEERRAEAVQQSEAAFQRWGQDSDCTKRHSIASDWRDCLSCIDWHFREVSVERYATALSVISGSHKGGRGIRAVPHELAGLACECRALGATSDTAVHTMANMLRRASR